MKIKSILLTGLLLLTIALYGQSKEESLSSVFSDSLYSENLNSFVVYELYLPKSYDKTKRFPIIYLLHGHGGNEHNWFEKNSGNVQQLLDSLQTIHKIPELIAISFDAKNTWYVDSKKKMESAFIYDILPFIESNYSVNKETRIIAGISAGGYGALRFSLKYPTLFQSSILLSPAAYHPLPPNNSSSRKVTPFLSNNSFDSGKWKSFSYPTLTNYFSKNNPPPKFYISTGDDDVFNILQVVSELQNFMNKNHLEQEVTVINGDHSWDVWRNRFVYDLIRIFTDR